MSTSDLLTSSLPENIFDSMGCWWGVTQKDNSSKEFEFTFQSLEAEGYIFLTSLPTLRVQFPSTILAKLVQWWTLVKRKVIQQFWGEQEESSRAVFLVISTNLTRRVTSTTFTGIGAEATIQLSGKVDEDTGTTAFQHEPAWNLIDNELNLTITESDEMRTCMIRVIGSRMFNVSAELKPLADQVWRYCA